MVWWVMVEVGGVCHGGGDRWVTVGVGGLWLEME